MILSTILTVIGVAAVVGGVVAFIAMKLTSK